LLLKSEVPLELVEVVSLDAELVLPDGAVVILDEESVLPDGEVVVLEEESVLPDGVVVVDAGASAKLKVCVAGLVPVTLKLIAFVDVWPLLGATSVMT
jgi:hypothetical protein